MRGTPWVCPATIIVDLHSSCDPSIVSEAQRQFKAYMSGDRKAIHSNLRTAVFRTVVSQGGEEAYEAVKKEYLTTTSIDGKEICLQSMGQVQTAELANSFLDFQYSDKVAIQDIHTGSMALANNSKARNTLWDYIKSHWDIVHGKLSGNPVVLNRYLKGCLSKFTSHDLDTDIAAFFENKDKQGFDRGLEQVSDSIRSNASYKERDEKLVAGWLEAHGYA